MPRGEKARARVLAVCCGAGVLSAEENRAPTDHMLLEESDHGQSVPTETADDREEQKRLELKGHWKQKEGDNEENKVRVANQGKEGCRGHLRRGQPSKRTSCLQGDLRQVEVGSLTFILGGQLDFLYSCFLITFAAGWSKRDCTVSRSQAITLVVTERQSRGLWLTAAFCRISLFLSIFSIN